MKLRKLYQNWIISIGEYEVLANNDSVNYVLRMMGSDYWKAKYKLRLVKIVTTFFSFSKKRKVYIAKLENRRRSLLLRPDKNYIVKRTEANLDYVHYVKAKTPIFCQTKYSKLVRMQIIKGSTRYTGNFNAILHHETVYSGKYALTAYNNFYTELQLYRKMLSDKYGFWVELPAREEFTYGHADLHRDNIIHADNNLLVIDWEIIAFRTVEYTIFNFYIHDLRIKFFPNEAYRNLRKLGRLGFLQSLLIFVVARVQSKKYQSRQESLFTEVDAIYRVYDEIFG